MEVLDKKLKYQNTYLDYQTILICIRAVSWELQSKGMML